MAPEPANVLTQASVQGLRAEQQDRFVSVWIDATVAGQLLAVMDGHGGAQTAEHAAKELLPIFQKALNESADNIQSAFRTTFERLNALTENDRSGTTLSMVFVPDTNKEAYVAVLGDSPVVILNSDGHLWTCPLHNVRSNAMERAAALTRGGVVMSGYLHDPEHPDMGLQLTRSLGDQAMSQVLSREPEISQHKLSASSFILLSSDGILNSFDEPIETLIQTLALLIKKGATAQTLVDDALKRQTGDNVTAVLWKSPS